MLLQNLYKRNNQTNKKKMLARSCCSYNIKELSPPKKQLLHKIHKTAQMTDTQQKPIHYKITQIYTNIKKKRISTVSNKIYSIKYGRFWAIFKVWHGLGWLHARLVRVDF